MDENEVIQAGKVNQMLRKEVTDILNRLEGIRQDSKYPTFGPVNIPMVLLLGNHSSGKSTFINYILDKDIQKTGRAPTDSTFTVIAGGQRAERLDGFALTRGDKYGFSDMPALFGRDFLSQLELKVVEKSDLLDQTGMILVDSPGMIDQPGESSERTDKDRGYDFKGVVKYLAERADVILMIFDPDKPGTTFESLDVLTSCLNGVSSKLLLILNKVDDFKTVHDFARAYGALCWNLSKMIPRKDMPFIYTMYVPIEEPKAMENEPVLQKLLTDEFDGTRDEVFREIKRAPDRATDNLVNTLKLTTLKLKMHCTILEACRNEYRWLDTIWKGITLGIGAVGATIALTYIIRTAGNSSVPPSAPPIAKEAVESVAATVEWKKDWEMYQRNARGTFSLWTLTKIVGSTIAGVASSFRFSQFNLQEKQRTVLEWLPDVFHRTYDQPLKRGDSTSDALLSRWKSVEPFLIQTLQSTPLETIPEFRLHDKAYLDDVLSIHIPRLDRTVRNRGGDDHKYLSFKHKLPVTDF